MPASAEETKRVQQRIRLLELSGMSRKQIAQKSGVNPSTITRVAGGQVQVTRSVARAILAVGRR